jgi:ectoine hydroxylase-related dioxygenase (phytanoyl-CoA dioxygenase family)
MPLGDDDLRAYQRDGYLLARGLVDRAALGAVLVGIDRLLCAKAPSLRPSAPAAIFDEIQPKVMLLAREDRAALATVYDAMRKLHSFWSLIGGESLGAAARQLMGTELSGVIFRGCGIRMDIPGEDQWRSLWHQEYHSQMSSLDGVTAWFNLVRVTHDMGPVELLRGSHREGLLPVHADDPMNKRKNYTQTFRLADEAALARKYERVSLETEIGDVLFLHFLTVHQSGFNRSDGRARFTCQVRYFDMNDNGAVKNGWIGGWQDGGDFTRVHPDKVIG